jgi:RNA polymerase sigma factor (sigma-70 family)
VKELKEWVILARSGDLEAYGRIVRDFQDMACGYAYSILGDFHLAQDAAQEAFIHSYPRLAELKDPEAFAGWFRRVVFTICGQMLRNKVIPTVGLERAGGLADPKVEKTEELEMQERVLQAVRNLPEHQRTVTTLFYINGYSQNDIAAFLEVPVTTVKKRLHDSRKQLKERMMTMVEETLKNNVPDERFSEKVIAELLARPRLLEMEGHPVKIVLDSVRAALPEYEYVEGSEIVKRSKLMKGKTLELAFLKGQEEILRNETTITALEAIVGKVLPVRLMTAGRVFRPQSEDSYSMKIFHQIDVIHIEKGITSNDCERVWKKVMGDLLGQMELKVQEVGIWYSRSYTNISARKDGQWIPIAGFGMINSETLKEAGFVTDGITGFAVDLGLERVAMLKYGIDHIRKLWSPPYVTE